MAHSAHVAMRLLVNGASLPVTHLGPDFLLLEPGRDHPPGPGIIVVRVDGRERRKKVILPHGIAAEATRVVIANP